MRRKNLIAVASLILLLVLMDGLGIPLKQSALRHLQAKENAVPICFTGKVTNVTEMEDGRFRMEVRVREADGKRICPGEKILLDYSGSFLQPSSMFLKTIHFSGILEIPQGRKNPGCFDYQMYLKSQGIFYQCRPQRMETSDGYAHVFDQISAWLVEKRYGFTELLTPDSKGLVSGVLFGDTSELSDEVHEEFRGNGTAHVLAVSGLHVGILYSLYRKIFGNSRSPVAAFCLLLLLMAYGTVSMWTPSVVRAEMMICLHTAAQLLDLRYDMSTGLSTVALFLILKNPYVIFSSGFQMSFLAVASICFLTPVLPVRLPDGMAAAVSVNLGLFLYQMYQFNYISLVALVVNIPIIYLTGILVPAALLTFFLYLTGTGIPGFLQTVLDSMCFLTVKLNSFSTLGGYGSFDAVSPPLWLVFSAYFLLFFFSSEQNLVFRHRKQYRLLAAFTAAGLMGSVLLAGLFACPVSRADVVFVDVGQGDCIHIRDGSRDVLIDGGGSWNRNTGEDTLKPYLLKNGAWNVDMAIATHLHMDHYKGLEELAAVYPVKQILTGMTAGQTVRISPKVFIETLWPLEIDEERGQEKNEDCSVFMIHYKGWKILVTGDLDEAGEVKMIRYYETIGQAGKLKADILKVGHHGSGTSTSDLLLDIVNPQTAVFQVGLNNIYGHPNDIIVEKILKRGIMVRRNDYNGGIGFSFEENKILTCSVIEF